MSEQAGASASAPAADRKGVTPMKWIMLAVVAIAGVHAVKSGSDFEVADDVLVMKACGPEPECIRRHNMARRNVLGDSVFDPVARYIPWSPNCPTTTWVAFKACNDDRS